MSGKKLAPSCDSAKTINEKAASWVARSLHENWSENDQRALDAWLAESPSHQIAYWRLESAWSETYRLAALRPSSPQASGSIGTNPRSTLYKAVAAIMLVAALGGLAVQYYAKADHRAATYSTALGERKLLTLADGSQIELNTDTVIEASVIGVERKIWVKQGEAYFHVKHDPVRPFVVIAEGRKIVDIGTEFTVRRAPNFLRVTVLEGRVGFGPLRGDVSRDLVSGDVATAQRDGVSVSREPVADIINGLSWRDGKLVFHHTPLVDAASEFNRYNSEKLVVANAAAGQITINGTFPTNDVHAFSRLAHAALGLRVEDHGQTIVISQR